MMQSIQRWRDWLLGHRELSIVAAVAMVLLAVLLWFLFMRSDPDVAVAYPVYFYDEASGELFVGDSHDVPPIAAPSGETVAGGQPAGVRAYVYACGKNCGDEQLQKVVYVERFTEKAAQAKRELNRMPPTADPAERRRLQQIIDDGRRVKRPGGETWHRATEVVDTDRTGDQPMPITRREQWLNEFVEHCSENDLGIMTCAPTRE